MVTCKQASSNQSDAPMTCLIIKQYVHSAQTFPISLVNLKILMLLKTFWRIFQINVLPVVSQSLARTQLIN